MEMGAEGRQTTTDLIQALANQSGEIEFFQAVRLIQNAFMLNRDPRSRRPIGADAVSQDEQIRFRSFQSLTFPASEITGIRATGDRNSQDAQGVEVTVAFLGLTGPSGVLPAHYTSQVIERSHARNKDHALRDFFDLFNHRAITFFYRAAEKHRLPFVYERTKYLEHRENALTTAFLSLAGMGGECVQHRNSFQDEVVLYFGGLFADRHRSAAGLQQLLKAYFQYDVTIEQMCERWMALPEESRSSFGDSESSPPANMELGVTLVAGSRFREIQSLFRVVAELRSWNQFLNVLPASSTHRQLVELIHYYAGIDLDVEIAFTLPAEEVRPMSLSTGTGEGPMLGWTSWLGSPAAGTTVRDVRFRYGYGGVPFEEC